MNAATAHTRGRHPEALDPIEARFRAWFNRRAGLFAFNPSRWDEPNDLFVWTVATENEPGGWVFIGHAAVLGNAFHLVAEAGLPDLADRLSLEWLAESSYLR